MNQIQIKLKDFRAIGNADIILNGITVVAGENGCGKSSLSKFLYYVFKISNEYDDLIDEELNESLQKYFYMLDSFQDEINAYESQIGRRKEFSQYFSHYIFNENYKDCQWLLKQIDSIFSNFEEHYSNEKNEVLKKRLNRIINILKDTLGYDYSDEIEYGELISNLKEEIVSYYKDYNRKKEERPIYFLNDALQDAFSKDAIPKEYEILEFGAPIIGTRSYQLSKNHSFRQIAYIDTPFIWDISGNTYSYNHWSDLNRILSNRKEQKLDQLDNRINSIIRKDILGGDIYYDEADIFSDDRFTYKRDDGSEFNLLECATGVKSFAMLQMMLKNGFFNRYTLLIIDEPEAHLHPQWIIEYARLIVLLNKHIGVKFFIASHNPDMVSAIKYISEKEEVDSNLNFYIAERKGSSYQYSYKHLGNDIEPIFESFNIALDRINLYGGTKDD